MAHIWQENKRGMWESQYMDQSPNRPFYTEIKAALVRELLAQHKLPVPAWAPTYTEEKSRPEAEMWEELSDPFKAWIQAMGAQQAPGLDADMHLNQIREIYDKNAVDMCKAGPVRREEWIKVPGQQCWLDACVFCDVNVAPGQLLPFCLWFHGGGFMLGSTKTHLQGLRTLARSSKCIIVSVDYRLTPEYTYPSQIEDAWHCTKWAATEAPTFGGDPSLFALGGDSAGGSLAQCAAMAAKYGNGPDIACQVLFYPGMDPEMTMEDTKTMALGPTLKCRDISFFMSHYFNPWDEWMRVDYRANPLIAPELAGFEPQIMFCGAVDMFRYPVGAYADRVKEAGSPMEYRLVQGVGHAFFQATDWVPEARAAVERAGAFMAEVMAKRRDVRLQELWNIRRQRLYMLATGVALGVGMVGLRHGLKGRK